MNDFPARLVDAQLEPAAADISTSDEAMRILRAGGVAAWRAWVQAQGQAGPTPQG